MKTLSYDCGNPVIICLRANARSAFLFTGSPRSFHSLAMTKGTKCPSSHHSCHSRTLSRHLGIGPPQTQMCLWGDSRPGSIAFPWMFEIIGYVCMFPLLRIIIISMDPGLRRDDKLQITNTCTPHSLTTPALRATPPTEGNLVRSRRGTKFLI